MIEVAVRAPSVHNTQPWRWTFADGAVHLYADFGRQLRNQDPDGRDLIISCGAALHHFRVAAAAHGWGTVVTRAPDPRHDAHLAVITFEPTEVDEHTLKLHEVIDQRRSDRRHLSCDPLPMNYLHHLTEVAIRHGAMAIPVEMDWAKQKLSDMLMFAHVVQDASEGSHDDDARWMQDRLHDGIPDRNRLKFQTARAPYEVASRFPAGSLDDFASCPDDHLEPCANWLVVGTSSDDTLSRLRAGEALSALLLEGTADRMSVLPLSQAMEVDSTRNRLEEQLFGSALSLQIVLQIGYPAHSYEPLPATPRRPVADVFSALDRLD
jgi:hypothetical protein